MITPPSSFVFIKILTNHPSFDVWDRLYPASLSDVTPSVFKYRTISRHCKRKLMEKRRMKSKQSQGLGVEGIGSEEFRFYEVSLTA